MVKMRVKGRAVQQRGMTLLEVLVALVIFATAAMSVIRAVSQHINTLSYLEEKTFASMVADNQMAAVYLSGSTTARSGTEQLAGRTWYWTVKPVSTSGSFLQAVDVTVAAQKEASPVVSLRSYLEK